MDGSVAIEMNREALVRIVASLAAMAGGRPTITRHVWRTILRLLRPAESAARRLIIAAARGIVVLPPRPRKPRPTSEPVDPAPFLRRFGIAVTGSPPPPRFTRSSSPVDGGSAGAAAVRDLRSSPAERGVRRTGETSGSPRQGTTRSVVEGAASVEGGVPVLRVPAFPLFDPPRRLPLTPPRRYVPAHAAPRIMFPGITQPHRLPPPPPPPLPDDLISAAGVARRLASLAAALADLPGQARRFARWKARMEVQRSQDRDSTLAGAQNRRSAQLHPRRPRRTSPLRGGPPYGGRLAVWDPTVPNGKHIREVDVILAHAHALADYALAFPDTS